MKIKKSTVQAFTTYGFVIAAYVIMQLLVNGGKVSSLLKGQLIPICAYIIMAVSLNLTVGVLGELSLGHAGFMSVGAFSGVVTAALLKSSGMPDGLRLAIAILVGGVLAGIAGLLVGIPVLRLKGDYLAIVTLAFGEIIKSIITNLYIGYDAEGLHMSFVTNSVKLGEGGKMIVKGPMGISGNQKLSTFLTGFVLVMMCLIFIYNLMDSKTGRAILALRDNSIAAESVGINLTKYKLIAFVSSAFMAGMAGVLFAMNFTTLAASKFDFNTSILVLVFVVLGGLGNMLGSIIAATLLTVLPELLRSFSEYRMLIYAIVLILVMIFTNNPAMKRFIEGLGSKLRFGKKGEEEHV